MIAVAQVLLAPYSVPPGVVVCLQVLRWLAAYYVTIPDVCHGDCPGAWACF